MSLCHSTENIKFNLRWIRDEYPMIKNNATLHHIFHNNIFPWFNSTANPLHKTMWGTCGNGIPPGSWNGSIHGRYSFNTDSTDTSRCDMNCYTRLNAPLTLNKCGCVCGTGVTCKTRYINPNDGSPSWQCTTPCKSYGVSMCINKNSDAWIYLNKIKHNITRINEQLNALINFDMIMEFITLNNQVEYKLWVTKYMPRYNASIGIFCPIKLNTLCTVFKLPIVLIDKFNSSHIFKIITESHSSIKQDSDYIINLTFCMQKNSNYIIRMGNLFDKNDFNFAKNYYNLLHSTYGHSYKGLKFSIYNVDKIEEPIDINYPNYHTWYLEPQHLPVYESKVYTDLNLYLPKISYLNSELHRNTKLATSKLFIKKVTKARISLGLDVEDVDVHLLPLYCLQTDVYCGLFMTT
jgi:hypothetical protein